MITIREIQAAVAQHYNLTPLAIKNSQRCRTVSRPRQLAMYLARKHTDASLSVIGRAFNKRHDTVIYAVKMTGQRLLADPQLLIDLSAIETTLSQGGVAHELSAC